MKKLIMKKCYQHIEIYFLSHKAILKFNDMKINIILFVFTLFASCSKDSLTDSSGTIISLSPIWSSSITDDGKISESGIIRSTIYSNNGILVGGRSNGYRSLLWLKSDLGTILWKWQDYPSRVGLGSIDLYFPFVFNGDIVSQCSYYNIRIGLTDGKSKWANISSSGFDIFNCFYSGSLYTGVQGINNENKKTPGIYTVNMNNGKQDLFLPVKVDPTDALVGTGFSGEVSFSYQFVNSNDTLISMIVTDPPISGYRYRMTTSLYNVSKKQWIYERASLFNANKGGVSGKPVILGNYMYVCSGDGMACFDLLTGINKWTNNFTDGGGPSGFLTSSPLIADGKIFIHNENTYLYCLDPSSGIQIWRQGIFGTCSHMEYLNGVVYFVCGGDGKLYAIDAANGNKLWAISSPDLKTNSGASFDRYVGLVPPQNGQNGKIVVTTGLNAYCYEACK